jgi:hypothetical protein
MRKETPSKDPIAIAYAIHQITEQLVLCKQCNSSF